MRIKPALQLSLPQEKADRNRQVLNVLIPATQILAKMTRYGIPISKEILYFKFEAWKRRLHKLKYGEDGLFKLLDRPINLNSHVQVKELFYDELKFPRIRKKDGKTTTNVYAQVRTKYEQEVKLQELSDERDQIYDLLKEKKSTDERSPILRQLHEIDKEYKICEKNVKIISRIREIKLLEKRYGTFVLKFLTYTPCSNCISWDSKSGCEICVGTGAGEPTGYDKHFVSEDKNGQWWTHPVYIQSPATIRLACTSPNWHQMARKDKEYNIAIRDIVVSPKGKLIVIADKEKAERWGAAIIFKAASILFELKDKEAVAKFCNAAFGVAIERAKKGTRYYNGGKTQMYASQYFAEGQTSHESLLTGAGIYITLKEARKLCRKIEYEIYGDYSKNVKQTTWNSLCKGYVTTLQGSRLSLVADPELGSYDRWQDIENDYSKQGRIALRLFKKACRLISSYIIQGSMTGVASVLDVVRFQDELDKYLNPRWSHHRVKNGDWSKARLLWTKHDELAVLCDENLVETVKEIMQKVMTMDTFQPYLTDHPTINVPIKLEFEPVGRQWDVKPEKGFEEMTEDKNPDYFYRDGILFQS
jgi:DNA polymerase I-like protein with 3'-5' exonuclease and polymerase domains